MTSSAMADGVQISGDLEDWARTAGFNLTPTGPDGRAVFSNNNGEVRYFLGRGDDRWIRVTCSNRMGPEQLELAAHLMSTIETYFYGFFGSDVRDNFQLPQATPDEGERDGRFVIRRVTDADQDYLARFDETTRDYIARFDDTTRDYTARPGDTNQYYIALFDAGEVKAVDGFGAVLAEIRLSDLAVYLSHDTEEIKASFLARDGGRLLHINDSTPA
jgi:hypothetical protein